MVPPPSISADGMRERTQHGMETQTTGAQGRLSRLILTGFMGAGKSTVGAILARRLGWRFVDLDQLIEARKSTLRRGDFSAIWAKRNS